MYPVEHETFLSVRVPGDPDKEFRITYDNLDGERYVSLRDWVKVPNEKTGAIEILPSSGAHIDIDMLDQTIEALEKIKARHAQVMKGGG